MIPFAIIKYYNFAFGERSAAYEKITSPDKETRTISKTEAIKIINDNSMKKVLSNEYGTVWELDGRPFFELFKGVFEQKEKAQKDKISQEILKQHERYEKKKKIRIKKYKKDIYKAILNKKGE